MRFIVKGNQTQLDLLKKNSNASVEWLLTEEDIEAADAFFLLEENASIEDFLSTGKPIFVNQVIVTLNEMRLPANVFRINGWPTFFERSGWEIAGAVSDQTRAIFKELNKELLEVADEPGLIAARVLAAVINEAYFALQENVSSRTEIDTAMRLGTNYPFGPFEWAEKVGLKKIYQLLVRLSKSDRRYTACDLLTTEATAS